MGVSQDKCCREGLYKVLSPEGNPEFSTVVKVLHALGLKLHAAHV